jgi:cellulose synthase/poly-beta-1,6-N-acetylglucosamine synthase-like glycosyltransferase
MSNKPQPQPSMSNPVDSRAAAAPGVSVVICSHNGASRLPQTLAYLQKQCVPVSLAWEVVLIDNASTDGTAEVAKKVWQHAPAATLRIVREGRLGLTFARERSLAAARYEIVTFVDDDNWVCDRWVQRVFNVMTGHPDVGACGGFSTVEAEVDLPPWFERYKNYYAVGPPLGESGDVTETIGMLWGAGMTIRRSGWLQLTQGGFRFLTKLTGEDQELSLALRLSGWRLWLDPELTMQHFMPPARLSWAYFCGLQRSRNDILVDADPYFFALRADKSGGLRPAEFTWTSQMLGVLRLLIVNAVRRPAKTFFPVSTRFEGDPDVFRIESYKGRLRGLIRCRRDYAANVRAVVEASWLSSAR